MARPGRRKTAAKVAPKKVIGDLISVSESLREDASPVIPQVEGGWLARGARKAAREMERVTRFEGNAAKLRRLARKPTMGGALAATMLLSHEPERIGHLAQARVGERDVLFAQRGRIPKPYLVSLQHHADPELRLYAYHRLLRKRPLWALATKDGVLVLPITQPPPREVLAEWGLEPLLSCQHLELAANRQPPRLELELRGADLTLHDCTAEHDHEALLRFIRRTVNLQPRLVSLRHAGNPFTCAHGDGDCPVLAKAVAPHAKLDAQKLLSGARTPQGLLDDVRRDSLADVGNLDRAVVVAGRTCYGEDREALVRALAPEDEERQALLTALERLVKPVVAEEDAPNKLLAALWPQIGGNVVQTLSGDRATAERILSRTNLPPREQLREAVLQAKATETLKELPRYASLPPTTALVDEAVRAYKVGGMKALVETAVRHQGDRTPHLKPVLYALYEVAGEAASRQWQFSKDDMEHGRFLAPRVRDLLERTGEDYHEELARVHTYLGETEAPRRV